jgi:thioredoxin reductase (NADPH)
MHDVVIIGAGPAGISAALWCDELGLDTLLLERQDAIGGQLHSVHNSIDNYPGCRFQDGSELVGRLSERAKDSDFDLWTGVHMKEVDLKAKRLSLQSGEQLQAIAIIIATGVRRRELGIPGEKEFVGKGIIESGTRDAGLFAGKDACGVILYLRIRPAGPGGPRRGVPSAISAEKVSRASRRPRCNPLASAK